MPSGDMSLSSPRQYCSVSASHEGSSTARAGTASAQSAMMRRHSITHVLLVGVVLYPQ